MHSTDTEKIIRLVESGSTVLLRDALTRVSPKDLKVNGEPLIFRSENTAIIRALVLAGAPVNELSLSGETIIWRILQSAGRSTPDSAELVRLLLAHGADINQKNSDSLSPLHLACGYLNLALVFLLCDLGADVNQPCGESSYTSLQRAVSPPLNHSKKQFAIVQYLIDKGAQLEAYDTNLGWTPLMSAAFHNNLDITKLLIERGAVINQQSLGINGYPVEMAMDIAVRMRCHEIVRVLT